MAVPDDPAFDPSATVALSTTRVDYDQQLSSDSNHPDHTEKAIKTLKEIDEHMRYDALVTSLSPEHVDEYIIDIYINGFGTTVSYTQHKAYPSAPGQKYDINNRIKVRFLPNHTLLILPLETPEDNGFGKVFSIVDSGIPGTKMFDYVRFADSPFAQS